MLRVVSSVLALRMIGIGLQMGWFMLLVRWLPLEQVGWYSAVNAFWVLMRALGPLGRDQALMRRLPELLQSGHHAEAKALQRFALFETVLLQAVLLGVAALAAMLLHLAAPLEALMIAAAALCYGINGLQMFVMLAAQKPLLANALETLWLPLALALAALALGETDALSLHSLLAAQAALMLGFCIAGFFLLQRVLHSAAPASRLDTAQKREFRRQSWSLFATASLIQVNVRLPVMLAPFFIGAAATAILEAALRFASLLGLMGFAAGQVYLPRISSLCRAQNLSALQQLLIESSWMVFAPTLLLYALLTALGTPLIVLITQPEYAASYTPMLVLGLAYVINASAGPLQHVFTMSGHARFVTHTSLAELALSLLLILLLSSSHGALGMALALAGGMILRNLLFHFHIERQCGVRAGVWSLSSMRLLLAKRRR